METLYEYLFTLQKTYTHTSDLSNFYTRMYVCIYYYVYTKRAILLLVKTTVLNNNINYICLYYVKFNMIIRL